MNKALVITDKVQENMPVSKRDLPFEWRWVVLVCMLLGLSGGIRYWRDSQFYSLSKESEVPPFPLREIPNTLGDWYMVEGSAIDPVIARVAGATDYVNRKYVDEKSGEIAAVLILYGLAYTVWPHTPAACYPANGFRSVSPSRDQDFDLWVPEKSTPARFRSQHFVRVKAEQTDYRVVYSSFQNAGQWEPDMAKNWKSFRYHPGMFKVQVECQASSSRKIDESSVKELLGRIVQEIERRSTAKG